MSLSVNSLQFQIIANALEYNIDASNSYYNLELGADFAEEVDQFHKSQLLPVNDKDLRHLRRQQKTLKKLTSYTRNLREFFSRYSHTGNVNYLSAALNIHQKAMELLDSTEGSELKKMRSSNPCKNEYQSWIELSNIQDHSGENAEIHQRISKAKITCTQTPEYQLKRELEKNIRMMGVYSRLIEEALAKNIKYETQFKIIDQFFNEAEKSLNSENPDYETALACISRAQIYFNISYDKVKVRQKNVRPISTQPVLTFKRVYCTENECYLKSKDPQEEDQLVRPQNHNDIFSDYWGLASELDSYRFARYRELLEKIPLKTLVESNNNLENFRKNDPQ